MSVSLRWHSDQGACAVEVPQSVIDEMIARADEAHPLETGASLFGHYSDDRHTAYVDGVSPTPEDAERTRHGFRRGLKGLAGFLERIFIKSRGKQYYVGEFHSHPSGAAVPSSVDDRAQFSIAKDLDAQCATPILFIVGGDPGARELSVCVYTRDGKKRALVSKGASI